MSHQEDKIRKLFQEKLDGIDTNPPEQIWDGIENELFPKNKKRPILWLILAATILGGLSIYFSLKTNNSTPYVVSNTAESNTKSSESHYKNESITNPKTENKERNVEIPESQLDNNEQKSKPNSIKNLLEPKNKDLITHPAENRKSKPSKTKNLAEQKFEGDDKENYTNHQPNKKIEVPQKDKTNATQIAHEEEKSLAIEMTRTNNKNEDSTNIKTKQNEPELTSTDTIKSTTSSENPPTSPPIAPPNIAKQFLLLSASLGRELRNYQFNDGLASNYPNLVDRDVNMRYRSLGVSYQNQFKPSWAWSVGLLTHRNRFITRLFPIKIANENLDDALVFNSSSGELKSNELNLSEFANTNQDTTVFLGRIIHRSAFLSIPVSLRWNTNNSDKLNFYVQTGIQFNIKMRERNTIILRNTAFERSFDTQRLVNRQILAPSGVISLGICSPLKKRIQWFGELNYAQYLGNYHQGNNITITSRNLYLSFGLRKPLK